MTTRLRAQTRDVPHATPSEVTRPFWDACARGELLFQRCGQCAHITFPPSEHCRGCLARRQVWEASAGRGTLYSWTVVHRPVTPAFEPPYAAAIVTLDEGYQMLTNIIDAAPEDLRAGLPVQVSFRRTGGDLWLPYFVPA
ncbi:Zn-ribbon domain-containing OB-fold protein [Spirillospora sp. NPDC048819]|uniref:Zn-ribbon domain-containing OB-fold protein n=1 Tax=Spirillospora sp. NPDC048819 TaxID=3155268 RepID=UPI00340F8E59